jgi:hypothetical protein
MYFAYSSGVTRVGRLAHRHDSHERLEAPFVVGCDRVLCRGTASLSARPRVEGSLSGSETEVDNGFEGSTILHKGLRKAGHFVRVLLRALLNVITTKGCL